MKITILSENLVLTPESEAENFQVKDLYEKLKANNVHASAVMQWKVKEVGVPLFPGAVQHVERHAWPTVCD